MQSTEQLPQVNLTRQELLTLWLRRNKLKQCRIAAELDISTAWVSRMIRAESIPSRHHRKLVSMGIPVELLPIPLDLTSGINPRPISQV